MAKEEKCANSSKYSLVEQYANVPECETQFNFPSCSSSAAITMDGKHAETKLVSKATLRKRRKQKSRNAHLKAITTKTHLEYARCRNHSSPKSLENKKQKDYNENLTTKSHLEINAQGSSALSPESKKQKTCTETFRNEHTSGKAVIMGQNISSTVDKLCSKASLRPWPSRNYNSEKDCTEVVVKQNKLRNCKLRNILNTGHGCFDFARGCTVNSCCLLSECGSWLSADPRIRAKHNIIKRRIVNQKETPKASPITAATPSTSGETSSHLELPGFYYDSEKKRYFKIVPSSNNCMLNVVTRERITFDKNEKLRQEELQSMAATGQLKDSKHQTTVKKAANVLTLMDRRMQGVVTQASSNYQLRRVCIAKLRPHGGEGNKFFGARGQINQVIKQMRIDAKENHLFIYSSTGAKLLTSLVKINGFRTVANNEGADDDRSFAVDLKHEVCPGFQCFIFTHLSDLCFATVDYNPAILYCSNNLVKNYSYIVIHEHNVYSPPSGCTWRLTAINKTERHLICCASSGDNFAVGTDCSVILGKCAQSHLFTQQDTSNSAIHAVTFANTSSKILFCAARNGRILMFDERSCREKKPVAYLAQSEGFSSDLYMTKDDRYLLSAKSNSQQIEKWDLRQGRIVVEYPGHISECARTPLVVDQREEFLSSVGSDSYTRIWDVRTGELMRVLPPPLPATKENIPSVCFVDLYGESRNNYPGLLLGMSNELHFYSL